MKSQNLIILLATLLIILSVVSTIFVVTEANKLMRENLLQDSTTGQVTFSVGRGNTLSDTYSGKVLFGVKRSG